MFSKRFLSGFLFFVVLFVPLLLSVQAFGQEPYTFVLKWGGTGSGNGQFLKDGGWFNGGRWGIAVDSQDNIYVVDVGNHRIQKFNSQGNYLLQWGTVGLGDGQFTRPKGIAVDKDGNVYVSEDSTGTAEVGRVQKFTSEGLFLTKFGVPYPVYVDPPLDLPYGMSCPGGIDFDKDGYLFLVNEAPWSAPQYGVIKKFNSNCEYVDGFGIISYDASLPNSFLYPSDIAINSKGEIYVGVFGESDAFPFFPGQIKKFNSSFDFMTKWYLDWVTGIAIDSEDNILACSVRLPDMGVYKYDSGGNLIQRLAPNGFGDGEIWAPSGIAVDSEGNVYIGGGNDGNHIQKFAPPLKKYTFEGFFSPIENTPTVNKANAGQAIPVKWRITDKNGLPISDPASFINITSYGVNCAAFAGEPTSIVVEEFAAGSSGLQYLGNGWWQFNWKTPKTYKGLCRVMKLTLDDKSEHTASFSFK